MKCDICDGPGPTPPGVGDVLLGRVLTICRECMNEHLAEKARARRIQKPATVDLRALSLAVRTAGQRSKGSAIHGKG